MNKKWVDEDTGCWILDTRYRIPVFTGMTEEEAGTGVPALQFSCLFVVTVNPGFVTTDKHRLTRIKTDSMNLYIKFSCFFVFFVVNSDILFPNSPRYRGVISDPQLVICDL